MEKYILSVRGDCNDADYMTKLTEFKGASLEDMKKVKEILSKLIGIDEQISEYQSGYFNSVIIKYITLEELEFIAKIR